MSQNPLQPYQKKIINAAKASDISYLAIFGSYSRGDEKKDSDIDLLIDFSKPKSLFDLIEVEQQLGKIIGKKVDLVTKSGLSKYIKPYVVDDLKVIYEEKS
jgi:hypothetical protein